MEEETMNLTMSTWEDFKGGKEMGKWCNYMMISKKKKK